MKELTNTHSAPKPKWQGRKGTAQLHAVSAPSFRLEGLRVGKEFREVPTNMGRHYNVHLFTSACNELARLEINHDDVITPAGIWYPDNTTSSFKIRELFATIG